MPLRRCTAAPNGRITTAATRWLRDRRGRLDVEQQDGVRRHQRAATGAGHADQEANDPRCRERCTDRCASLAPGPSSGPPVSDPLLPPAAPPAAERRHHNSVPHLVNGLWGRGEELGRSALSDAGPALRRPARARPPRSGRPAPSMGAGHPAPPAVLAGVQAIASAASRLLDPFEPFFGGSEQRLGQGVEVLALDFLGAVLATDEPDVVLHRLRLGGVATVAGVGRVVRQREDVRQTANRVRLAIRVSSVDFVPRCVLTDGGGKRADPVGVFGLLAVGFTDRRDDVARCSTGPTYFRLTVDAFRAVTLTFALAFDLEPEALRRSGP